MTITINKKIKFRSMMRKKINMKKLKQTGLNIL